VNSTYTKYRKTLYFHPSLNIYSKPSIRFQKQNTNLDKKLFEHNAYIITRARTHAHTQFTSSCVNLISTEQSSMAHTFKIVETYVSTTSYLKGV